MDEPTCEAWKERTQMLERLLVEQTRRCSDLEKASAGWRETFDTIPDLVALISPSHELIRVNRAGCQALGKTEQELRGKKCYEILHDRDRPIEGCPCESTLRSKGIEVSEFSEGGESYQALSSPVLDDTHSIVALSHTVRNITDRKKAEQSLKENEEKYRALFENFPVSLWEEDFSRVKSFIDGLKRGGVTNLRAHFASHPEDVSRCAALVQIISVNRETVRLFEASSKEDVLGSLDKLLVDESLAVFTEELLALDLGRRFNSEIIGKTTRGNLKRFIVDVVINPGCGKDWRRVLVSLSDISDRKKAEEALRESQLFNETILSASPDVIYIYDLAEQKNLYSNEGIGAVLGYTAQEVKDMGDNMLRSLMHPDDFEIYLSETLPRYQRARDGESIEHEYRMKHKTGGWRWLNAKESVFSRRKDGSPQQIFGITRDITARKQAEAELRQSKELLRVQFENSPDMILMIDRNCKIRTINRILAGDHSVEELIGMDAVEQLPPGQRKEMRGLVEHCLLTGEIQEVEHALSADRLLHARLIPIRDIEGAANLLIYVTDITEKKKLEDQLVRAQKLESLGRLAGGVAHDFNNILTTILGYAELLKLSFPDSTTEAGEAAEVIIKGVERASDLTRQLLGFARGGRYNPVPLNVNEVIEDTAKVSEKIFDKKIRISLNLDECIHPIEADRSQLDQILTNLFINARDAMPEGGELFVSTDNVCFDPDSAEQLPGMIPGSYVRISVADSGTGMTKDVQDRVFEPFFTTKDKGRGTGLGLAMVYGIAKNHGGYVYVDSKPGEGATFTLYFPASRMLVSGLAENAEVRRGSATVLVVDDEEDVRNYTSAILAKLGYRVHVAEDGRDAVEVFSRRKGEIDLVLLDMIMPEMDGRETCLKLRGIDPGVRVLLTSGYSQDGTAAEVLREGAVGFLQKPFKTRDLAKMVAECVRAQP